MLSYIFFYLCMDTCKWRVCMYTNIIYSIVKLKKIKLRKFLLAMLNQESHNSIHLQTADFVHYREPLVSLLFVLSDLPFAVVLRILAERYIEVVAVTLIAICNINVYFTYLYFCHIYKH